MGNETVEHWFTISSKSEAIALKDMTFNINVGFSDLDNPDSKTLEGKKYALI